MGRELKDVLDPNVQAIVDGLAVAFEITASSLYSAVPGSIANIVGSNAPMLRSIKDTAINMLEKDLQNRNGPIAKALRTADRITSAYSKMSLAPVYADPSYRRESDHIRMIDSLSPQIFEKPFFCWGILFELYFRTHYINENNVTVLTSDWNTETYKEVSWLNTRLEINGTYGRWNSPNYSIVFNDHQDNGCIVTTTIVGLNTGSTPQFRPFYLNVFVEHDQLEDAAYNGTEVMVNWDKLERHVTNLMLEAGCDLDDIRKLRDFSYQEAKQELNDYFNSIELPDDCSEGKWSLRCQLRKVDNFSTIIHGTRGQIDSIEYTHPNGIMFEISRVDHHSSFCFFTGNNPYDTEPAQVALDGHALRYIIDQIKNQADTTTFNIQRNGWTV
jgi:hypothetical protein